MSTRKKEKLPFYWKAKGSREAGTLIDTSFQNIVSLLWMNTGIHEAGKWSQLPTNLGTARISNYLWGGGEGPRRVPGGSQEREEQCSLNKSLSPWQGEGGWKAMLSAPEGRLENKGAILILLSWEAGWLALP